MPEEESPYPKMEIPLNRVRWIACQFDLPEPLEFSRFPGTGNIHRQTFLIAAGRPGNSGEYLLQMLNTEVFTRPDRIMDAMISCIRAQNKALSEGALPENNMWEPIRLIPTRKGAAYLKTDDSEDPQYWRMMAMMRQARSYGSLSEVPSRIGQIRIAEEAGRGLAMFGILTAAMSISGVSEPLPGYRNTALYYDQLDSVLRGSRTLDEASDLLPSDPVLRQSTGRHFLIHLDPRQFSSRMNDPQVGRLMAMAFDHRSYGLDLQRRLKSGNLKTVIIHGDPKLDNFLFNAVTGKVMALVDLDTVMPHTWLSDWGDMTRSLINISGERHGNPEEIEIDLDIFKALARGFIGSAPFLPPRESELMADAARIMALELGVRFLTDYVRGDTYFKPGAGDPADLNKTRAAVQFSIFQSLGRKSAEASEYIAGLRRAGGKNSSG